ncbi:3368_t:CDS:1 [Funneliformis mosseae]|uniref:3368_t:CDS:1 n=1 Tax=Funneliformis mosseae TaxID=27381 RepID=A0A9N8WL42_FUNMO|nr:3368_t:CDS:1 [Funneliformis mosseae]
MPTQTFSAKIIESKLSLFYRLMYKLSKGNDELIFGVYRDKLVITIKTNSFKILITFNRKVFDSFHVNSPRSYTIFSSNIRDAFSGISANLSSLRIMIEESDGLAGAEDIMKIETNRKTRSFRNSYNIVCNKISEIEGETNTETSLEEKEENHWSINSEILNREYWPHNCKNENIRFLFAEEALRIIYSINLSDGKFSSESRYSIPRSRFEDYNVTNQMDIKINRKSFERIMNLVRSLKCNLNAYFSDIDTDDPYQPQPFYLCGEFEKYIKIEGEIFGDHLNRGNDPERPPEWEIEALLNNTNQVNQNLNNGNGIEYQVAGIFREDNTEFSNSNTRVNESNMSRESNSRENHTLDDNVSDNYHSNYSRTNTSINSTTIPSMSTSRNDSRSNYTGTSSHSSSGSYIPPGEEISRRLGAINFNDHRVSGMKRNFDVADLDIEVKREDNVRQRTIRLSSNDDVMDDE